MDLSVRVTNGLARDHIHTIGDLQLRTEEELRDIDIIGDKAMKEIDDLLRPRGCRLRDPKEPLHERARKVFEGTGTAYISIAYFRGILGKKRLDMLCSNNRGVKSAGPLAKLSREEIDWRCRRSSPPLTDDEAAQLRKALQKLGLEPHV